MAGGAGRDVFRFRKIADSPAGGRADRINDFTRGQDKLDLSGTALRGAVIVHAPQLQGGGDLIRIDGRSDRTIVLLDKDGGLLADFRVIVKVVQSLDDGDFIP